MLNVKLEYTSNMEKHKSQAVKVIPQEVTIKTLTVEVPYVKVGVYGTLRSGQPADIAHFGNITIGNTRLEHNYLGTTTIKGHMTSANLGFPYVSLGGEGDVVIEVYEVPRSVLLNSLDTYEGYPHHYNRTEVDTPYGKVWVYNVDVTTQRGIPIPSGDWSKYVESDEYLFATQNRQAMMERTRARATMTPNYLLNHRGGKRE